MSHTLHQLLWQARRTQWLLALHAILWFFLTWLSWRNAELGIPHNTLLQLHSVLLCLTGLMALTGADEPAMGTRLFWRTRPVRWQSMWFAQVLYVVTVLAGPVLLCWAIDGFLLDLTWSQWRSSLTFPFCMVSALLMLAALRALTSTWKAVPFSLAAGAGLIAAGSIVIYLVARISVGDLGYRTMPLADPVPELRSLVVIMAAVSLVLLALVWALRMRRALALKVYFSTGIALVVLPAAVWHVAGPLTFHALKLKAATPAETLEPGERGRGLPKYTGVPDGLEPVVTGDYFDWDISDWDTSLRPIFRYMTIFDGMEWLTVSAAEKLKAALPNGTRWYSTGIDVNTGEYPRGRFRVTFSGFVIGRLLSSPELHSLKLVPGASRSARGIKWSVIQIKPGRRNLSITLDIRRSQADFWEDTTRLNALFVLHLPALPAALLCNIRDHLRFESFHGAGARIDLQLTMPDAETATGAWFSPEVLQGAELWLVDPGDGPPFVATPEGGAIEIQPD